MLAGNQTYEELLAKVIQLQDQGKLPKHVTREQAIDWAHGNTKIENENVTRQMATKAVDENPTFRNR